MSETVTVDALYEAASHISEAPVDADFETVLLGVSQGPSERAVAAQLISRYAGQFAGLQEKAVTAMIALSKDGDVLVRKNTVRGLPEMLRYSKRDVAEALFDAMSDVDSSIVSVATSAVVRTLKEDNEIRDLLLERIKTQNADVQLKMIDFVRENVSMSELAVTQFLDLLSTAFDSCLSTGLRLLSPSKLKLLSEEQVQTTVTGLLERLSSGLEADFGKAASEIMIPLLRHSRTLGDSGVARLLEMVADKVMPRFSEVPVAARIELMQKLGGLAKMVDGDKLLTQVYDVFLSFPDVMPECDVNFSIFEATLWTFLKLASGSTTTASNLIGMLLIFTGQPGESQGVTEDSAKYKAFRARLEVIREIAPDFIDSCQGHLKVVMTDDERTEEKKKAKNEKVAQLKKGLLTGDNCKLLCNILLSDVPLGKKLPKIMSWSKTGKGMTGKKH